MLTITGIDQNGRVTPKGTNVVIPAESAGIGDLIYRSSSSFKIIGRGTASASSITISGTTYTLYGVIYGFVNGEAMIVAPSELGDKPWGSYVSGMPTWGDGTALMRNGLRYTYVQMNTERNSNTITGGSSAPLKLPSAYQSTSLSASTFDSLASDAIKSRYNTWNEYIRQTLRVNGAPGSPFGAIAADVKVHEFGRWMGRTYGKTQSTGTALRACYEYQGALGNDAKGDWWLPSMYELAELMIDEHLNKVNENGNLIGTISVGWNRWSSVPGSSDTAWHYHDYGRTNNRVFTQELAVRPVSLFKL